MDLISRQDAIDEVVAWLKDRMSNKKNGKPLTERLKDLPSAQPEIIRCKDCKHYTLKPQVNSNYCYIRHCTRSALISSKPDDYCSWAERRQDER